MSSYYLNYRRRVAIFIFLWLVLFTFAAAATGYWMQYLTVTALLGLLILVDFMFLEENTFVFDPNFRSWQVTSGTGDQ